MHRARAAYGFARPFGCARCPWRRSSPESARESPDEQPPHHPEVHVFLSALALRATCSDAAASGSYAANPANAGRREERVAQRLVGIERLRQREDNGFGAGAVL